MTSDYWDRLDESSRPRVCQGIPLDARRQEAGEHLRFVHEHFRRELILVIDIAEAVLREERSARDLEVAIDALELRRNMERFGSICGQICHQVTTHHRIEDVAIFPTLQIDEHYGPMVRKLADEHLVIHDILVAVDHAMARASRGESVQPVVEALHTLRKCLLSHFDYEEEELPEALGVLGISI